MNRFLHIAFLFISISSACFWSKPLLAQDERSPNIIFILTDDQRWDAMGFAGNKIIQTRNMDRLAKKGIYFKNAFATTPICAASRASLLTGMHERTHKFTFQQGDLKDPYIEIAYPNYLKKAGYYTGFFGKLGVFFKNPERLFEKAEIYDRNDKLPDKRGYYKVLNGDSIHLTRYTSIKAQEFIRNAPKEKPFFLAVNFSAPHAHDPSVEQYFWDEKYDAFYLKDRIPDPLLSTDSYFLALPKEVRKGFNRIRWTWRFDTPERYQKYVKGYYRMISQIDDEIGKIQRTLKKQGLDKNTIIIFASDNGYFLADRQIADKWLMYEPSIRIPLIIYDPRQESKIVEEPVLNIDIPSTILDLAHATIPSEYQGQSLLGYYLSGRTAEKRDAIMFEHLWKKEEIPSSEGIRTKQWKYFRYRFIQANDELYDLVNDPLETKNLSNDPNFKKIKQGLIKELEKQISFYEQKTLVKN